MNPVMTMPVSELVWRSPCDMEWCSPPCYRASSVSAVRFNEGTACCAVCRSDINGYGCIVITCKCESIFMVHNGKCSNKLMDERCPECCEPLVNATPFPPLFSFDGVVSTEQPHPIMAEFCCPICHNPYHHNKFNIQCQCGVILGAHSGACAMELFKKACPCCDRGLGNTTPLTPVACQNKS